uniref:TRPM SLOG domain-containing protein n=1 Tax=Magallana gigas TaxID=29159 RepID=K1Q1T2_MAGGI
MSGTSFLTTEFQITQDLIGVESTWNGIKEAVKSTPTVVFSVIGDSENFISKPWQTNVFQTALIEAARSGGDTWILYRGLESGVSKIISDAYRRYVNLKCSLKSDSPSLDDVERHIKLISFAGRQSH